MKKIFTLLVLAIGLNSCQDNEPALSSDKSITEFKFLMSDNPGLTSDASGLIEGDLIYVAFPAGTSVTALKPTIVHTGNTISPASGVSTNFSGLVEYTVTAQDRSTTKYTVVVTVQPEELSSDKKITSFSFLKVNNPSFSEDVHGTITGQTILFTLPSGSSVTALTPTIVHTGATISPASGAVNNFNAPVTYTVTAEDGSTESYTISVSLAEAGPVVYVAGAQRFFGTNYVRVWKNGTGTSLTNGTYNSYATSVFVKGNKLYVAGTQSIGRSYGSYWEVENGVQLPTPALNETVNDAYINSIFVSDNNDVYVAGQENHGAGVGIIAKVWKNGTATHLTPPNGYGAAHSVFVSGNDVYVAGWEETATGTVAKVWKNGAGTTLSPENERANARAVFVSNGVVYVAGEHGIGTVTVLELWKDGVSEIIDPNTPSSHVSGIFVSDGNIYLVGQEINGDQYYAKIWKNGTGTFLSTKARSDARSVYVHNGDVYVAGWEYDDEGNMVAVLWKNGVATNLATDAFAYGVMVK